MNTFAKMKDGGCPPNSPTRRTEPKTWIWGLAVKLILMCMMISGAFLARIVFKAKTESLSKEAARMEEKIRRLELETIHLRNRKAALTARPCIMAKIGAKGLRAPEYNQISYVTMIGVPSGKTAASSKAFAEVKAEDQTKAVASR